MWVSHHWWLESGDPAMKLKTASLYMQAASGLLLMIALMQVSINTAPAFATLLQGRVEHHLQPLSAEAEKTLQDSFPQSYEGNWHCVTTVTDSAVSDVTPGMVTQCDMQFKRAADGRILGHWAQPGWTESQSTIVSFNKSEAQMDRSAYYWADGAGGAWATRSRDSFTLTANNSITANSYVDQYIDGNYLGRYKTNSVLTKLDGPATTAMLPATR